MVKEMNPRHEITPEYNADKGRQRRWELTIEWLKQFDIDGMCLDCGDRTTFTDILDSVIFAVDKIDNTTHDLNFCDFKDNPIYTNILIFEVIEHLMNPLLFLKSLRISFMKDDDSTRYLSTPIKRPKWMRNKEHHFHEFNYNELCYLIDQAGFKIIDEKRINITRWWYMFTGIRPLLRVLGFGKTILLRLRRK